jgi:hypothetical protein
MQGVGVAATSVPPPPLILKHDFSQRVQASPVNSLIGHSFNDRFCLMGQRSQLFYCVRGDIRP